MNILALYHKVFKAYDELKDATNEYRNIAREVKEIERQFELKKAQLHDEGKINGRNKEAREAQAIMLLNEDYEDLMLAQSKEDLAYQRKEQAEIEVEKYRAILRIEEIAVGNRKGILL